MASGIKDVKFTAVSKKQLNNVTEYILTEFGYSVAEKFIHNFESKLAIIAGNKVVHNYFLRSKKIRYFIFNKKNLILYKDSLSAITVIGVYSTKQNIGTIKKRFKK